MFYDESAIKVIASTVGRPVKVDITTKTAKRRRFVRACVEVDLSVLVKRKIWVEDQLFSMEYETLHMICGSCDRHGHFSRDCMQKVISLEKSLEEAPENDQVNENGKRRISRDAHKNSDADIKGDSKIESGRIVSVENDKE